MGRFIFDIKPKIKEPRGREMDSNRLRIFAKLVLNPSQLMAKTRFFLQISFYSLALLILTSAPALADDSARRLLALVDYISSDYKNAVQAGKVLNPNEYQEQLEFSRRSLELLHQLKQAENADRAHYRSRSAPTSRPSNQRCLR